MQTYAVYRCDYGHQWTVRRDLSEQEKTEDTFCPFGHEAVTCTIEKPADEVKILIEPASRITDPVREQVAFKGQYWLVLLDRDNSEILRSARIYPWEEVVKLGAHFRGRTPDQAQTIWQHNSQLAG